MVLVATAASSAMAQRPLLPRSRADVLLDSGLWPQAEQAYYAQSRVRPRDPIPRAALGQFLAMKGAVLPGTILIEEARQFGLDSSVAATLLEPWRAVLDWRAIATLTADSVVTVRPPRDSTALFQLPLPRNAERALRGGATRYRDTVWADVVPRLIGADSLQSRWPRIGVELIEGMVPSFDVVRNRVTLHADRRSALRARGNRYRVMRDAGGVRVLMTEGRVMSLRSALEEMQPAWWQLDLAHGVMVVR